MTIIKKSNIQALIISALSIIIITMPTVSAANNYNHNKHYEQRTQNTHQPKQITKRIKRHANDTPNAGHQYQPRHAAQHSYNRSHRAYAAPPAVIYAPPQRVDLHNLNVVFGLHSPRIGVIFRH